VKNIIEKQVLTLNHLHQNLRPKPTKLERNLFVQEAQDGREKEAKLLAKDGIVSYIV
jgi:hypothetical protein